MPIYEYGCIKCGHQFEILQKLSDSPLKTCPSCKGRLTKLISQTSFQLKGSGWYVSDYARKPESKPETKSDSKSDSKKEDTAKPSSEPAAKSEPAATPKE